MTIKTGTPDDIRQMFKTLNGSVKEIIKSVVQLVYFMRGSIQYDDMMWRTPLERDLISEFIKDRLEGEAKKQFPVY